MMARYQVTGDLTAPLAELSDAAYVEMRGMPISGLNLCDSGQQQMIADLACTSD